MHARPGKSRPAKIMPLVVGLDSEEARQRYDGHIWQGEWRRGAHPTALIEKDGAKNERSIRTVALTEATMDLVDKHRVQLVEPATLAGVEFADDGFVFPAAVDGSRPWRPDLWTRRFAKARDAAGIKARLHDVRHFVANTRWRQDDAGDPRVRLGRRWVIPRRAVDLIVEHLLAGFDPAALSARLGTRGG